MGLQAPPACLLSFSLLQSTPKNLVEASGLRSWPGTCVTVCLACRVMVHDRHKQWAHKWHNDPTRPGLDSILQPRLRTRSRFPCTTPSLPPIQECGFAWHRHTIPHPVYQQVPHRLPCASFPACCKRYANKVALHARSSITSSLPENSSLCFVVFVANLWALKIVLRCGTPTVTETNVISMSEGGD